jgi:uncharacterized protein YjlB
MLHPEIFTYVLGTNGFIPNSHLPLVIYKKAFIQRDVTGAEWLENTFHENHWSNAWRNGVFTYHHYHSITHEVLGVYDGESIIQFGGENGQFIYVQAGDIIVIPAGVGHKNLGARDSLKVVGAYPNGMDYDIKKESEKEYAESIQNLRAVPFPPADPLLGQEGICNLWKQLVV